MLAGDAVPTAEPPAASHRSADEAGDRVVHLVRPGSRAAPCGPALARAPVQSASSVTVRVRPAGSFHARPSARSKVTASLSCRRGPCSAAAARPCRGPSRAVAPGKISSLRLLPTTATWSPAPAGRRRRARRPSEIQDLPPPRVCATASSSGRMKPSPASEATSSLRRPGRARRARRPAPRSAGRSSAAPARPCRGRRASRRRRACTSARSRRRAAAGRWSRRAGSASRSPSLNLSSASAARWPFIARIQPISEQTTVIGSRSIIASKATSSTSGASSKLGPPRRPARPCRRPCEPRSSSAMRAHCAPSSARSGEARRARGQRLALGADLHLLELAEVAEAHVEDRLGLHVR